MAPNLTEDARQLWDQLSETDKQSWTHGASCQQCSEPIDPDAFNGSVHEGQLALFHHCDICGNKEVRLIDVDPTRQEDIDDDFERWLQSKKEARPESFKKEV